MSSTLIDLLIKKIPEFYKDPVEVTKLVVHICSVLVLIATAIWVATAHHNYVDYIIAVFFPIQYIIGRTLDDTRKI
jgi:hypothetical protein